MTQTLAQSVSSNASNPSLAGVTAGNALTVQTSFYRGGSTTTAPSTPTDTNGTFSAPAGSVPAAVTDGANVGGAASWYQKNVAAGTHTLGGLEANHNSTLAEWTNTDTTAPLDASNHNESTVNAHTSQTTNSTGALAQANELILITLCLVSNGGNVNVGLTDPVTGYSTLKVVQNDFSDIATMHAYRTVTSTTALNETFSWTDNETSELSQAVIMTLKEAGGGGAAAVTYPQLEHATLRGSARGVLLGIRKLVDEFVGRFVCAIYLLAKYNTQTDFYFPMVKRAVVDLAVTADWTPATGDTKVSKDGGAVANTTNNPAIGSGASWKLTLTAAEPVGEVDHGADRRLGHESGRGSVHHDPHLRKRVGVLPGAGLSGRRTLRTYGAAERGGRSRRRLVHPRRRRRTNCADQQRPR
jgi:hypothetical protein